MLAQAASPPVPRLRVRTHFAIAYLAEPNFWTERVVLKLVSDGSALNRVVSLNPALEYLDEDLAGPEVMQVVVALPGRVPAGINPADYLSFEEALGRSLTSAELDEQIAEVERLTGGAEPLGERQAIAEDVLGSGPGADLGAVRVGGERVADRGVVRPPPVQGPPPAVDAGSSGDAVGGCGLLGGVMAELVGQLPSVVGWVVAFSGGGFIAGDPVPQGEVHQGKVKGFVIVAGGTEVFICTQACFIASGQMVTKRCDLTATAASAEADRPESRVLKVSLDIHGNRHREFRDCILQMTGDVSKFVDTPVNGPATLPWLMRHMLDNGGTPLSFHSKWLSEVRLDYGAAGTAEHQTLCKILEVMLTVDQLDASKLVFAELVSRKLQMIHEKWKAKLPSLAPSQSADADDGHLILGISETRGNLGVCPALTSWLGEQLAKEASVSKERRKAREERALGASKK